MYFGYNLFVFSLLDYFKFLIGPFKHQGKLLGAYAYGTMNNSRRLQPLTLPWQPWLRRWMSFPKKEQSCSKSEPKARMVWFPTYCRSWLRRHPLARPSLLPSLLWSTQWPDYIPRFPGLFNPEWCPLSSTSTSTFKREFSMNGSYLRYFWSTDVFF